MSAITWGSYAAARRASEQQRALAIRQRAIAVVAAVLASGGPVEDEMDAAEQVVDALIAIDDDGMADG